MHWLDKLCEEHGIKRYALATKSGVSEQSLSNAVTRSTKIENIKFGTVLKIAKAFDITTDELYTKTLQLEEENKMTKLINWSEEKYKELLEAGYEDSSSSYESCKVDFATIRHNATPKKSPGSTYISCWFTIIEQITLSNAEGDEIKMLRKIDDENSEVRIPSSIEYDELKYATFAEYEEAKKAEFEYDKSRGSICEDDEFELCYDEAEFEIYQNKLKELILDDCFQSDCWNFEALNEEEFEIYK